MFPGCEVGAMPPLGPLYGIPVSLDGTLAGQETRLASLRDLAAGLKQKKTELEAGLNKLIEAMEF